MKYLILALLLLAGCTTAQIPVEIKHKPRFQIGDCVNMSAMTMTAAGEWNSTGHILDSFKIVDIVYTEQMNKYMAENLHATHFYKVEIVAGWKKQSPEYEEVLRETRFVIPMQDLDGFRYATVFWELPENATLGCNDYSEKK